ncbi:hypothetical protein BDA99DRAFT_538408 [Phascolomyces articulosus]|uniref:Uncharacterized protein n=1 Tax=Phascolomyces articulosus TaxID=60185 RepID=A0AAD5JXL5_9FUNG|nr:hypothetical protein BDA99DRAFT_538408 [Phascolomyces articulosus]
MSCNDTVTTAVLWYLNGCMVSIYQQSDEEEQKRPLETLNLPYPNLSYKNINILKITQPAVNRLSYLATLNLQNNQLGTLPPELWQLTGLQELNISRNQITNIPPDIAHLVNLCDFYAYSNQIQELPSQMGRLTDLRVLDLTANKLNYLPAELLRMKFNRIWIDKNDLLSSKEEGVHDGWKQLQGRHFSSLGGILSLRSTCIQTIGQALLDDPDQRKLLQESCLTPGMLEQLSVDPISASRCTVCQNIMFHDDLRLIRFESYKHWKQVPFLYRACSQTCWNKTRSKQQQKGKK